MRRESHVFPDVPSTTTAPDVPSDTTPLPKEGHGTMDAAPQALQPEGAAQGEGGLTGGGSGSTGALGIDPPSPRRVRLLHAGAL